MKGFTHYWSGATCEWMVREGWEGKLLDHTAGKQFTKRGISVGDKVYVVNIVGGVLYLIGRLEVGRIVTSDEEAKLILGYEPWSAPEHLIAKPNTGTPMVFDREVPLGVTRALQFENGDKYDALKFVGDDELDRQTLRGVRRLTTSGAQLLERELGL